MTRRILLLAVAWLAQPVLSEAAALIELETGGRQVRIVVDRPAERVLMIAGDLRTLFDLGQGFVYHGGDGAALRARARYRPGYDEPPPTGSSASAPARSSPATPASITCCWWRSGCAPR